MSRSQRSIPPEGGHAANRSSGTSTKPESELVTARPVFELKIRGAAISGTGAGERQSSPLSGPAGESSKNQSARLRRDDEDASGLMRRIRKMLVQRDGIRSAEKRIAEAGLLSSVSAVEEPMSVAADAETSKRAAREKLLAKLQAEKALLQPAPHANRELEEMEKSLKAQARLRIKLAREKGVDVASGSVATGMNGVVAGGLSIKGAASAAAMEQGLRAKLLSRRDGATYGATHGATH